MRKMSVELAELAANRWHPFLSFINLRLRWKRQVQVSSMVIVPSDRRLTSRISLVNEAMRPVSIDPVLNPRVRNDIVGEIVFQVERLTNEPTERLHVLVMKRIQLEIVEHADALSGSWKRSKEVVFSACKRSLRGVLVCVTHFLDTWSWSSLKTKRKLSCPS